MSPTILLICGTVFAIGALYVIATRGSSVHAALAGESTAVGLRDAGLDTLTGGSASATRAVTEWQVMPVSSLSIAEDMLDSMEAHGVSERELIVLGNSCFAVRWR